VVDAHVHFWDPTALDYPWLREAPGLNRAWLPEHYAAAHTAAPVEGLVFVEANPHPERGVDEARWVERLAAAEPRIRAIVAFIDLADAGSLGARLDGLEGVSRVRGVRHNIQGNPPGFCLQPCFVAGVREAGRRDLTFDLCATHDQLGEVVELVRRCPDTRFALDHCGKPAIRAGLLDPWRHHVEQLAAHDTVWCKVSGLLTEADPVRWTDADLRPYAEHVVDRFGAGRVMYGSDWPVLTLVDRHAGWYAFTRRLTRGWSEAETDAFYRGTAQAFYGITTLSPRY
jgi:L-fuconolactonase